MFSLYLSDFMYLNNGMSLQDTNAPFHGNGEIEESEVRSISYEDLIEKVAAERNQKAFINIFEHFAPRIKSFLLKSGMNEDAAEDVTLETMANVWNKASTYNREQSAASTWIFTIARNKKIDALRKTRRAEIYPEDPLLVQDERKDPDETAVQNSNAQALSEALKELPREQSDVLFKAYFEDKTHQAIAEETRLPLGTVKSRIRLALERLRKDERVKSIW